MRRIFWWRGFKIGDYMLGYYHYYKDGRFDRFTKKIWRLTLVNKYCYNGVVISDELDSREIGKISSFNPEWGFSGGIKYYKLNKKNIERVLDNIVVEML